MHGARSNFVVVHVLKCFYLQAETNALEDMTALAKQLQFTGITTALAPGMYVTKLTKGAYTAEPPGVYSVSRQVRVLVDNLSLKFVTITLLRFLFLQEDTQEIGAKIMQTIVSENPETLQMVSLSN